jgi:hypothetical protein
MATALSYQDAVRLCRESMQLADQVERSGGPPENRAADFYRARHIVEQTATELATNGIGFGPLVLLPWLLLAAGTIVGIATIPSAISGTRRIVDTTTGAVSSIVTNTQRVVNVATWGAAALAGYWATRKVLAR